MIGGTVLLAVLLFFAPRTPEKGAGVDPVRAKIDAAVRKVQDKGSPPMEGIRELQRIAKEHPENDSVQAEVNWQLGRFSVRSGQYRKAADRFEKVLSIAPRTYQDAYLYLARTYATLGDTAKAIERLKSYRQELASDSLREQVDGLMRSLKSKRTNDTEQTILNDAKR